MNRIILNCYLLFTFFFCFSSLSAQVFNIGGEAYIVDDQGEPYLINYDQKIQLSNTVELTSTSYVYLTLQTDAEIKSINVTGLLHIKGDDTQRNFQVGTELDEPAIAIKCNALEVRGNVNIRTVATTNGIESDSYIEFSGTGNHSIFGAQTSLKAGTFLSVKQSEIQAGSYNAVYSETAVSLDSLLMATGGAILNANGTTTGITCEMMLLDSASINGTIIGTASGSRGISVATHIIADHESKLTGSGTGYGIISDTGMLRADNSSIEGTGTDGSNAISAQKGIYAINGGIIQETYPSSINTFVHIKDIRNYPTEGNTISRSIMIADEYVKIDAQSTHRIVSN